jgi:hypothetical protein
VVVVVVAVVDIVVFIIIVTIIVRTIYSDSLIHQSLEVISKQIQKNLKLESDAYITDYSTDLKYRLSKPIMTVSGTLKR